MRFIATVFLAALPLATNAQEVIGSVTLDGREVILYADQSWEYGSDDGAETCETIARKVDFCGTDAGWERTLAPNADITATYRFDDWHYGQMIVEELGVADGLTDEFMRDVVIETAASVIGGNVDDVDVIETYWTEVSSRRIPTIVYAFNIDGLDVVYANGIRTAPNRTMQLMTFSIGTEFTQRHRDLHEAFLSQIRIAK